jgi:Zn-dependent protease
MITLPGQIPLRIHPLFWLLVAYISAMSSNFNLPLASMWAIVVVMSILIHELGHALTAKMFGHQVSIELEGLGGKACHQGPPLQRWQEFLIVLNGPLAGLLLAALCWGVLEVENGELPDALWRMAIIGFKANIFWTLVNLMPVEPLDGGKLLRIILETLFGFKGLKAAHAISTALALLLASYFFVEGAYLYGGLFLMTAFEGLRTPVKSFEPVLTASGIDSQQLFKSAELSYQLGYVNEALHKLSEICTSHSSGKPFVAAVQLKGEILYSMGAYREGYELLHRYINKLDSQGLHLLQRLLYSLGLWSDAIAAGDRAFRQQPSYEIAIVNAQSYGHLGEAIPAVGWLKCALREGIPSIKATTELEAFNAIRSDPNFHALTEC